jgi:hypothetical protein
LNILLAASSNWIDEKRIVTDKSIIYYSSQLMGSGKTFFGQNIQQKIQNLYRNKQLKEKYLENFKDNNEEVLKLFVEAKKVYIDLKEDINSSSKNSLKIEFQFGLWKKLGGKIEEFKEENITNKEFLEKVYKKFKINSMFLIIDEVGLIENLYFNDFKKEDKIIQRFYVLFSILAEFSLQKGVFIYVK